MGEIRNYECSCGYKTEAFTGAGLNGCNVSVIERFFPIESHSFLSEREQIETYMLDQALTMCPKCQELQVALRFSYKKRGWDKSFVVMKNICPECRDRTKTIDDLNNVTCPKCGDVMNCDIKGRWD